MAIYHYSAKVIGRSTGRSVTAAAAYRAGEVIHDSTTGQKHDYERRGGVIESEILTPENTPEWARDRSKLWNSVEQIERRKDAQLAREVEVSLPHELSQDERRKMLSTFAKDRYVSKGMIADISYHSPGKGGDDRNYHAHILLTLRPVNENGEFANKNRDWNHKHVLVQDREAWADCLNQALEQAGSQDRVDSRSFQERGLDQKPTQHLGPDATEMERRGKETRIGDENREAEYWNRELAELEEQEKVIDLAIEREKRRLAAEPKHKAALALKGQEETLRKKQAQGFQSDHMLPTLLAQRQNDMQLKHLDERRALEGQIDRRRADMEATGKQFYDKAGTVEAIAQAEEDLKDAQTFMGRVSGREQEARDRVEALRLNLGDIDRRQGERTAFFDRNAQEQLSALDQRQQEEAQRLHSPPSPELESETEDFREYTPDDPYPRAVNDNDHHRDRDYDGPEFEP